MESRSQAIQLMNAAEGLILDFDGPVCDVFAQINSATVAAALRERFDIKLDSDDPLSLLQSVVDRGGGVDQVDDALIEMEVDAVRGAPETSGIKALIRSFAKPIAIASNNSRAAIEMWMEHQGLGESVMHVEGRDPRLMKPDPQSVLLAAAAIGVRPSQCVFLGDSSSDYMASQAASVKFIALANKPYKRQVFEDAGCLVIVDAIKDLLPSSM